MRSIRRRPLPLRPGEILVPARAQGQDLSSLLGRRITIDRIRRTGSATGRGATSTVRVVGLVDPGWQVDGPDPAYGSLEDVDRWAAAAEGLSTAAYRGERGYDRVDVVVRDLPVATARARLQRAGYTATSLDQLAGGLPAAVDAMRTASRWGMVLLLVLVVGCAAVVSLEEVGRREAEVGMLQALGWSPAMVARTLLVEVGAVAVASAAGSLLGGSVATWALHRAFDGAAWTHAGSSGIILPSLSLWLAMSVAIVVLALVGAGAGTWRAVRMDPATALSRAPDAG
jgi:putative ABC transport system permease protein